MNETDTSKILVAIARLEEKYDNLDDDMKIVVLKIDDCMKMNAECNSTNFKYMVTTILGTVAAIFGWSLYFKGAF